MSATAVENEKDMVIAGLIQQIRGETELRTRQGEIQQRRQELTGELKAVTADINKKILECNAIDLESARQLLAIDKAKFELLKSTPEGKQILALEAELKDLAWGEKQVPQLNLLRHQVELAIDQGKTEESGIIRGRLANLEAKIEQRKAEIDQLWQSFGFEMAWFLR